MHDAGPSRRDQALFGLIGGALGALAMDVFARVVRTAHDGLEAHGATPGSDRDGRGMQPPQALTRADQDAAVLAGTIAYRAVSGHQPRRAVQRWLGTAAHYSFGAVTGLCYATASERAPVLRSGFGALYGSLVWAIADEGLMPVLGLSRKPGDLPLGVHAYALCGHWVYGATLEGVRRLSPVGRADDGRRRASR